MSLSRELKEFGQELEYPDDEHLFAFAQDAEGLEYSLRRARGMCIYEGEIIDKCPSCGRNNGLAAIVACIDKALGDDSP